MRVLVTGRGKSGSWVIRGEQLGSAIGAVVQPNAGSVRGFDACIVVKRPRLELLDKAHQSKVPIIWDVVDSWPQPNGNYWSKAECLRWLAEEVKVIKPAAIVAATQVMASDCLHFGVPVVSLPHHARPKQNVNPVRESVRVVGYEGGEQYLGHWKEIIERECKNRGWSFVVNPTSLADLDIVVAVRHQTGYAPRHWKSNVKLANAMGSGTPIICNREAGYLENASGVEQFADYPEEFLDAIEYLAPLQIRSEISKKLLNAAPSLENFAVYYSKWLASKF